LVSGTLAFYGPGDTDWPAAKVNLPVAAGAWLMTDPQSRAEMRVGADSIDLSSDTQLNFAELRDQVMQIVLTQGRIDLHLRQLNKDETAEIDVPRGGVWLLQPGVYDIDSGGPDQPTRITVFEGSARFAGGGIDTFVSAGDVLVLSRGDTLSAAVERAAPDEFVRWCRSHDYDEKRLATPRHISPAMTGYEELDAHGEWAEVPTYGKVWFPGSMPGGWAPYRDGRWVWIEPWGWNWVDDEPWGFAPCHYGRWAHVDDRWAWVPGEFAPEPVYAPALVAFIPPSAIAVPVPVPVGAGPPVGWFPLAPGEIYWPAYTRNLAYIRNVNITNVNITKINTIIAARPAAADPPPQVVRQQFANRAAATVVPTRALVESSQVRPAAVVVPPNVLREANVVITPPLLPRPAAPVRTAPASTTALPSPPSGHTTPPAPMAPTLPTLPTAVQSKPPGSAPTRLPARPNFSALAPAPRVSPMPEAAQKPPEASSGAQAVLPGTRQPSAPPTPAPQPGSNVTSPASMPGHPAAPDFSHLAPAQVRPHAAPQPARQPAQIVPGSSPPGAPAAAAEARQPVSEAPATPAPAPTTPPAAAGHPPGSPDFARLPSTRPGPQPPANPTQATPAAPQKNRTTPEALHRPMQAGPAPTPPTAHAPPTPKVGVAPSAAPDHGAQQRAAAEAAARQQAQQRAAAEAAVRQQAAAAQQARQRAAAEAAARQQAAAAQQAQQRAAAEAAARQRATAAQQAQQRAAAEAAPRRQQAAQQAQQHGAAREQHTEACGHPGRPPCPK